MTELRGGKGGYGGITSMNSDQRTSPYHPHKGPFTKYILYNGPTPGGDVVVLCGSCGKEWQHPKGDPWGSGPGVCDGV